MPNWAVSILTTVGAAAILATIYYIIRLENEDGSSREQENAEPQVVVALEEGRSGRLQSQYSSRGVRAESVTPKGSACTSEPGTKAWFSKSWHPGSH